MLFLNQHLQDIIIPYPCKYHDSFERNWIFNLFYKTPGWAGGHPFPSNFNLFLTFIIGILVAYIIIKKFKNGKPFRTRT